MSFRLRAAFVAALLLPLIHLVALPASAANGVISGTVRTDTGEVLTNACVDVLDRYRVSPTEYRASFVEYGCTNEAGNYYISVPPGTYVIELTDHDGIAKGGYYGGATLDEAVEVTVGDGETATDIDALLSTGVAITGTVTAANTGEPVPGACVDVYMDDYPGHHVNRACTDETGAYSVGALEDSTNYKVEVGDWNSFQNTWLYGADSPSEADVVTAPAEIDIELVTGQSTLDPPSSLRMESPSRECAPESSRPHISDNIFRLHASVSGDRTLFFVERLSNSSWASWLTHADELFPMHLGFWEPA